MFGGEVNATKVKEKEEGVPVTEAEEDVCSAASGDQCQAGTPGSGASQFEGIGENAVAVDALGTVYVGDIGRVQKFSAGGEPGGEIPLTAGAGMVERLAVDSGGAVYVLSEITGIHKYDGAGVEQLPVRDAEVHGAAASITVGAGDELFVRDPQKGRLLEYDAAGVQRGSFPEGEKAAGGIALNDSTGTLYTLYQNPSHVLVQTLPPLGPFVLEESASEVLPTSAVLNATVNPEGPEETSYHFEYGTSTGYGTQTPPTLLEGGAEGEFKDQPVKAAITGLEPSTVYHFRVVVTNALNQTTFGADQTFQTLPPVSIDSESATAVTATSAKLLTELNPHGLASEYHFEYGPTSSYGTSAPLSDADAGEGSVDEVFSVTIEKLHPHTVYHYRVVAHNTLGVVQGADQTFTTQGVEAAASIDGRGDEMVSPPEKHGISLEGLSDGVIEASSDGGGLAYFALGPIDESPAGNRSSMPSQLLAKREAAGVWATRDIATPHQAPAGVLVGDPTEYKLFSSDLSRGAVEPFGATPLSPVASERTPYLREPDGSYTPLVYPGNVPAGTKFGGVETSPELFGSHVNFVTGTPDLSHMLLRSPMSLVQGFENEGQESDYEWSKGKLAPVSILPSGAPASEEGQAQIGNNDFQVRGAISADGGRVFFATTTHGRLYVREMPRGETPGETLRVDAAAPDVKPSEGNATFQLASSDGSRVFFTDSEKLTKEATAVAAEPDLYECQIVRDEAGKLACELTDLSVDGHPGEVADVLGAVIGAGEDGRYVYFAAKGALTEGEGAAQGACPQPGEGGCVNLYVYDTLTHAKRLVAVLSANDFPDWAAGEAAQDLGRLTSRVSPDGRYLAFMSQRPLTGLDNRDAHSGVRDEEVFEYHLPGSLESEPGILRCVSCEASGARPVGVLDQSLPGPLVDRPHAWESHWLAGSIPGWTRVDEGRALHQPRYLSNSGRLFFNSVQALVPADGNGTQDVYEFEPDRVGGCGEASGCVSLVSSGSSSEESAFLDASETGGDVFFLTAAQLSGADQDNAFDVYDAHVCTLAPGCAARVSGTPPPCVSNDACLAAPEAQPDIFGAPASATFIGAGNLMPSKAKTAAQVRAEKLAGALRSCHKRYAKHRKRRVSCEKQARRRYSAKISVHDTNRRGK
jgi:hypothetical protein